MHACSHHPAKTDMTIRILLADAEHELRDTLKELSRRHTIIIVTHSPILLAACDNLVALDKGKVALAGPATDILPWLCGGGASRA